MALKETTKKSVHQKLKTEKGKKDDASYPSSSSRTPNPSRLLIFLHFSLTKVIHNRKLNFCSVWMSQEAFLPHVNGMATRHFWKEKMTMQVKRLSGIKSVQVINETGCRQKSNRKRIQVTVRGNLSPHSQHFRAAHTMHGKGENLDVRIIDPISHRHLNPKPFVINLAKSWLPWQLHFRPFTDKKFHTSDHEYFKPRACISIFVTNSTQIF